MSEEDLLFLPPKIGFVFQEGALFDSMTFPTSAFRLREENTDEDEVETRREALRFVEMEQALTDARRPSRANACRVRSLALW